MNPLVANHCCTAQGAPLVTLDGLPGGSADLTPAQLRSLAAMLHRIADDADTRPQGKGFRPASKSYDVGGNSVDTVLHKYADEPHFRSTLIP